MSDDVEVKKRAPQSTLWVDGKQEKVLCSLLCDHITAAEIATEMSKLYGATITKNAIISKLRRMGIRLSRDKHKFMRKPKPEPPPAKIEFVIPAPPPPPPAPIQLPEPGVPFLRRGQHQCAWIEGNSRAEIVMCCGKPIPLNSRFAFCKKHMEKGLVGRKS